MIESYLYLTFALIFTSLGQVLYKYFFLKKKFEIIFAVLISFCLVPLLNYKALIKLPIDMVYTATAITLLLVLLLSKFILNEQPTKNQIYGSGIILIGIILYNF